MLIISAEKSLKKSKKRFLSRISCPKSFNWALNSFLINEKRYSKSETHRYVYWAGQNFVQLFLYHLICAVLGRFSHIWLCDPTDCIPPGSSVHGILQARILEWVAMPSSRGSSQPRDWTRVFYISCIDRQVLYHLCHLRGLWKNPNKLFGQPNTSLLTHLCFFCYVESTDSSVFFIGFYVVETRKFFFFQSP